MIFKEILIQNFFFVISYLFLFKTTVIWNILTLRLHYRSNFCAPGEYLIHKGDALASFYYLCNGSMEVVKYDMVVAILGNSSYILHKD